MKSRPLETGRVRQGGHSAERPLILACLLGCVLLCACAGPSRVQRSESQWPKALTISPHLEAIVSRVRVHLPEHDQAHNLTIEDAQGIRQVERQEDLLSDGSRTAPQLIFQGPQGVRCEGTLHPGRVLVEPHPLGGLRVIAELPLENYIECVVAAELSLWSAEPAELEAQAVAARSYALATLLERRMRLGNPDQATLQGSTQDQAYRGVFEPTPDAGSLAAARRLRRAMTHTRGQVLFLAGQPLPARFSAACGGHTAAVAAVFPSPIKAIQQLQGAPCPGCLARAASDESEDPRGPLAWETTFSAQDLSVMARSLGLGSALLRYDWGKRDSSGRWLTVILVGNKNTREVPAETLRARLGHGRLRSTRILSSWPHMGQSITSGLQFTGLGHGHGVGLCQQGARDAARAGRSSRQILLEAYPGTEIRHLGARTATP